MAIGWISLLFLGLFTTAGVADAVKWNSAESVNIYNCEGDTTVLPWNYTLDAGEKLVDLRWYYQAGGQVEQLVASYIDGHFFLTPDFQGHVAQNLNAGLILRDVSAAQSGKYWVDLDISSSSNIVAARRTAFLHVTGNISVEGDALNVIENSEPVQDNKTKTWHVQLACGKFTGDIPGQVIWTTPSGKTRESTHYEQGYFYFLLDNPVQEGVYNCSIPPSCAKHFHGSVNFATRTVEGASLQLVLLEATVAELRQRLDQITEPKFASVSFHATLSTSKQIPYQQAVIPDQVAFNEGGGYSNGTFTAPLGGNYVFLATAQVYISNTTSKEGIAIMLGDTPIARSQVAHPVISAAMSFGGSDITSRINTYYTGWDTVTTHVVAHLAAGQKVWLRSNESPESEFAQEMTSFSGFLLHAD